MIEPDIRRVIAARLEAHADWRRGKAREFPHDERNAQAASTMLSTAEYVRALPENDARLVFLSGILDEDTAASSGDFLQETFGPFEFNAAGWNEFTEAENQLWGRIGFDGPSSPSESLNEIVALYRDAVDRAETIAPTR